MTFPMFLVVLTFLHVDCKLWRFILTRFMFTRLLYWSTALRNHSCRTLMLTELFDRKIDRSNVCYWLWSSVNEDEWTTNQVRDWALFDLYRITTTTIIVSPTHSATLGDSRVKLDVGYRNLSRFAEWRGTKWNNKHSTWFD